MSITPKELYEWAVKNGVENYKIKVQRSDDVFKNDDNIDFDTNMGFIVPLQGENVVVLIQ